MQKLEKWDADDIYLRYGFFLPDDRFLNVTDSLQFRNARTAESLNFLLFNFCNNWLFVEVANNEVFDFLTSNSNFLDF